MSSYKRLLFRSVMIIILLTGALFVRQILYTQKVFELQEKMAQDTLKAMTLKQKIGQVIHVGMPGTAMSPEILKELEQHYAGGVILFASNMKDRAQLVELNKNLQAAAVNASGIPLIISTDQEGGRVKRVGQWGVEQFPSAMAMGQADEVMLTEAVGFFTGLRLNELGIQLVLAPTLDINNNPENPVINTRSFGSDYTMVVRHGTALDRGLRKAGSVGSIKHFPGHGDTDTDSHYALPVIDKSLEQLRQFELIPFKEAILNGAELVMSAHILFPALDKERPATLSPQIMQGLLREELGFQGLIITDAMEMDAIDQNYSTERAAVMAIQAGADILLLTSRGEVSDRMFNGLLAAVEAGEISEEQLNESVLRQLRIKVNKGIFHRMGAPITKQEEFKILTEIEDLRVRQLDQEVQKYEKLFPDGESQINQIVSELSIKSLKKPFAGLDEIQIGQVAMLTENKTWQQYCSEKISCLSSWSEALAHLQASANNVLLAPLSKSGIPAWNKRVKQAAATSGTLIALYENNPFLAIAIPENGAVLASFSSTKASRQALIDRALAREGIEVANLLTEVTEKTLQEESINQFAQ